MSRTEVACDRVRRIGPLLAMALSIGIGCGGCSRPVLDDGALAARIAEFEAELAGKSGEQKSARLAAFARRMLRARVTVRSATVVAVYERGTDWDTRPFFGFDYVEAHYVRLADLDPGFYRQLHGSRYWASVARTSADRQLMFELAMDEETHAGLRPGQAVAFACEVAGIIRGKTIYARLVAMDGPRPAG